jgi:hypothetical protein
VALDALFPARAHAMRPYIIDRRRCAALDALFPARAHAMRPYVIDHR